MTGEQIMLLLLVVLPIAGAALGYALRRLGDLPAYAGIASLVLSAALSLALIRTIEAQPADAQHPILLTVTTIALPSVEKVPAMPLDATDEQRGQFLSGLGQYLAENPAVQALPIQLNAGRSQLLFAITTALIAALCLLFGLWERKDDLRRGLFFATLTLFSSAMLLFLCADTLLLIYLAWELMGLCSFVLIAHPGTERARRAARQAFWTTRATDFALLFAVIIVLGHFGWTTLSSIDLGSVQQQVMNFAQQSGGDFAALMQARILPWVTAAALLVLLAVIGKTALFPLSFWLPEAMVAPSPVSALLHAATMVAAGPFLLVQLEPLYAGSQTGLIALTWVGGLTLVLAGLMALCARDAKRVLAYSTISQLSVPILGAAVFASGPSLYHIIAHAWFKAPLFLAVGYLAAVASRHGGGNQHVTEHSGDGHDADDHTLLTRLSGSARRYPLALAAMVIAGLALAGLAFTGGFFGKEQVLLALQSRATQVYQGEITFGGAYPEVALAWRIGAFLMLLSLPITAAYSARLIGILVLGKGEPAHGSESERKSPLVTLALVTLAALVGCVALALAYAKFVDVFSREDQPWRWIQPSGLSIVVDLVLVLTAIAIALSFSLSRSNRTAPTSPVSRVAAFFDNGMYLREFWTGLFGRGGTLIAALADRSDRELIARVVDATGKDGRRLARASSWFDLHVVDGLRYWAAEFWWVVRRLHQRWLQNGSIQHYMFVILLSAAVLCLIVIRPLAKAFGEILGRM